MATANPSSALRMSEDYGSMSQGNADFVLLDDELRVTETRVGGERVWAAV